MFDSSAALRFTRFALNPNFTEAVFGVFDVDNDGEDEIVVGGIETGGAARGPAFQIFDGNGTLLLTRFVLNADFTDLVAFPVPQPDGTIAIGVGGVETGGLARGPAVQVWASNGSLLFSRFVLNSNF